MIKTIFSIINECFSEFLHEFSRSYEPPILKEGKNPLGLNHRDDNRKILWLCLILAGLFGLKIGRIFWIDYRANGNQSVTDISWNQTRDDIDYYGACQQRKPNESTVPWLQRMELVAKYGDTWPLKLDPETNEWLP